MNLHELHPFHEETKPRKRLGRGEASGLGKTSGKGHKGQRSRAGASIPAGFEGGQMPLQRRLPKRGFKNPFRVEYAVVNLERIAEKFDGASEVSLEDIYASGLCQKNQAVKILGQGEVNFSVKVTAHRFSKTAAQKIADAGGTAVALEG
ncbi:50S ribosomal protein L15 [Desulfonatronovibrio hydrogenovorans]|uniref:50S ribosomal protein L15 n=1 Tax=Desulfonatronovibrio hydrogenovorans TaxID=53245 RepID=UPI000491C139|nr:50S ribosomal protein L15 [Desulfonatronovibrio hydrogenovorans]